MFFDYSYFRKTFPAVKKVLKHAKLLASGRIANPILAEEILSNEEADAVIMMRAQIADPHLANKVKQGFLDDIIPCVGCNQACYGHVADLGNSDFVHSEPDGGKREGMGRRDATSYIPSQEYCSRRRGPCGM